MYVYVFMQLYAGSDTENALRARALSSLRSADKRPRVE